MCGRHIRPGANIKEFSAMYTPIKENSSLTTPRNLAKRFVPQDPPTCQMTFLPPSAAARPSSSLRATFEPRRRRRPRLGGGGASISIRGGGDTSVVKRSVAASRRFERETRGKREWEHAGVGEGWREGERIKGENTGNRHGATTFAFLSIFI